MGAMQRVEQGQVVKQSTVEGVLVDGNLAGLSPDQRVDYYMRVCESLGLNPLTKPFAYLNLNGKLTLYALKDCTEQLRKIHSVSLNIVSRELVEDVYVVTTRATLPNGRADESIGAVSVSGLKGESRANAFMKAETKAKRRATLSICGLGMLDETETDTIPDAKIVYADSPKLESADVIDATPQATPTLATNEQKRQVISLYAAKNGIEYADAKVYLTNKLAEGGQSWDTLTAKAAQSKIDEWSK